MRILNAALLACALAVAGTVPATGQEDAPRVVEVVVESFDATPIVAALHLPAVASAQAPVPVVLKGHGWGLNRDIAARGGLFEGLLARGYAVLVWDARGFGQSGGEASVDSLELEARDVQALIDWAAQQPEILLEAPGDPIVGMSGESYGGGIQLASAAIDPRIDALVPEITWSSLNRALMPNQVLKLAWLEGLFGLGLTTSTLLGAPPNNPAGFQTGNLAPELIDAQQQGLVTNTWDEPIQEFFRARSLEVYGATTPVRVPTLLLQGSVDTLFTLDEATSTFRRLRAEGVPVKLVAFCGGLDAAATGGAVTHGVCPSFYEPAGDRERLNDLALRWYDRYLRGLPVDTGPAVEYRTNAGVWHRADDLPEVTSATAEVAGSLVSTGAPGNGLAIFATAAPPGDPGTVTAEVLAADSGPVEIVGTPHATLEITGTGGGAHLFVKLVDRESGELVGEGHALNQQETPFIVGALSDTPQVIDADLVTVAYTLPEGHHLDVQVSSSSGMSTTFRGGPAQVTVAGTVSVPVRGLVVDRVAGPDRVSTAAELSRDANALPGTTTVVIARAGSYPDALAGGPLAAALGAPAAALLARRALRPCRPRGLAHRRHRGRAPRGRGRAGSAGRGRPRGAGPHRAPRRGRRPLRHGRRDRRRGRRHRRLRRRGRPRRRRPRLARRRRRQRRRQPARAPHPAGRARPACPRPPPTPSRASPRSPWSAARPPSRPRSPPRSARWARLSPARRARTATRPRPPSPTSRSPRARTPPPPCWPPAPTGPTP